jgi:nudix-type nucleoside diphosphatase (YffH/AdpP family)
LLLRALRYMKNTSTVDIKDIQTIAEAKGKLSRISFQHRRRDGQLQERKREVYDSGNSATALPYDAARKTVLLTRQLRLPMYMQDGLESSIETCAGKLDGETAEKRMVKEIEEELGYRIRKLDRLFELYVSPAAIMEKITFFTCSYSPADRISDGGGLAHEGEDIQVIETTLEQAAAWVADGTIVDAKTVVLIQYLQQRLHISNSAQT